MSWSLIFGIVSKTNPNKIKHDIKRIEGIIQKYPCKICIRHYHQYLDLNKVRYDKIQTADELKQWFIDYKSTIRGVDRGGSAATRGRRRRPGRRRVLKKPKLIYL